MSEIFARRIARIVFGGVLLAGVAWLFADATGLHRPPWSVDDTFGAARTIGATWLVAALAAAVARRLAARVRLSGGPDRLFAESLMVPAVGIALLLPLTIHLPIALWITDSAGFDFWVQLSMGITGLPHAVFAFACAVRAYQLVADRRPPWSPRGIYIATVVTSCVPFILLYAIPPVLVALTGLPFIPMMHAMGRIVARERAAAAAAPHGLPRAIVRMSRPA